MSCLLEFFWTVQSTNRPFIVNERVWASESITGKAPAEMVPILQPVYAAGIRMTRKERRK